MAIRWLKARMKHLSLLLALLFLVTPSVLSQIPDGIPLNKLPELRDGSLLIEDFSGETPGELPSRWMNQKGEAVPALYSEKDQNRYHYRVVEEQGNRFLRFEGVRGAHLNFPVAKAENYNIRDYPLLSWRWRAHKLPPKGDESRDSTNDVTASIYVVYSVNWLGIPKVIRYTWSSSLPEGTELSKNFGHQKILVVQSGEEKLGEWITFKRDIREDYRELHGGNPPDRPLAILILSDGVSTDSEVMADYDDIRFLPAAGSDR